MNVFRLAYLNGLIIIYNLYLSCAFQLDHLLINKLRVTF